MKSTTQLRHGALLLGMTLCLLPLARAQTNAYVPQQVAPRNGAGYVLSDGSVQIVTYRGMAGVIEALNALFIQTHPGVKLTLRQGDNYSGMATLTFDATAFAPLGTEFTRIGLGDNLKIAPEPTAFRIAHASLNPSAAVSPLAIIVNKNNPLQHLTLDQVTRIFAVGGPASDITRWGQLGVKGSLAGREIRTCGPPGSDYYASDDPQVGEFISVHKMGGLNFSHTYEQMPHYADVIKRVSEDPAAIGIAPLNLSNADVKVIGLAASRTGTPYQGSLEDIKAGRYPYDRYLYIYLRANPGMQYDPFAKEYMRMVLSPQGQQTIAAEAAGYIPLNDRELSEELAQLER